MSEDFDLDDISGTAVADAEAAGAFKLEVPEWATASKKPVLTVNDEKYFTRYWSEAGRVLQCKRSVETSERTARKHNLFEVQVEVGPEGSGLNVGKKLTARLRLCKEVFANPDLDQKEATMNRMSIVTLKSFLETIGADWDNGEGGIKAATLAEIFTPQGLDSPVVDQIISFEVSQKPSTYKLKPGQKPTRYDVNINRFTEVE